MQVGDHRAGRGSRDGVVVIRTAQALVAVCFMLGLIGELQRQEDIELVREQRALYLENHNAK